MKQLKLTGFIFFLLSLTESLTLPTKPQDVDHFSAIQKFIDENTASLALIAFAQYVQEVTFEEAEMLLQVMMEYKEKCLADTTLPECSKVANEAVQDMMCAMKGLSQRHNFSHCCSKIGFEKRLCFLYNKKANIGFLPPFPTLDPEEKCQAYKNDRKSFLNRHMYEVARRNPFVFAPVLLTVAARFEEVATACCEEQQKANCFGVKAVPITQYLKGLSSYQKNVCGAFLKFGPKVLNSINIAVLSKKFPKIGFTELTSLLEDVSSMYDGCCEGDVVRCIRDQSQVMNHICSKQDSISSKIKECCEKETPEREDCIVNTSKDDRPANLSLREPKFTDSENMCQERDSNPNDFFAEFIYEYSRRHVDLSTPELLRITQVYKDLLEDCCRRENPPDCYRRAEEKFNETTEKSLTMVQQECKRFQGLGKDGLQHQFLVDLVRWKPELTDEELLSLFTSFTAAGEKCCEAQEPEACLSKEVVVTCQGNHSQLQREESRKGIRKGRV
uniref:Afamin n=1 Tax=Nannospalax galili TaxID=1026970 RepID=A0A8C6QVX4_NANGA